MSDHEQPESCTCTVCGRVQLFSDLANRREWRFGGEGGADDLLVGECSCGNTLSRSLGCDSRAA